MCPVIDSPFVKCGCNFTFGRIYLFRQSKKCSDLELIPNFLLVCITIVATQPNFT